MKHTPYTECVKAYSAVFANHECLDVVGYDFLVENNLMLWKSLVVKRDSEPYSLFTLIADEKTEIFFTRLSNL